jgi:sec-independent protein translocase protein TatC
MEMMPPEKYDPELPWTEHLEELRLRLIIVIIVWFLCGIVIFIYTPQIIKFLSGIVKQPLAFFSPTEALFAQIKLAGWGGLFLTLPWILFHLHRFLLPALDPLERKWLNIVLPLGGMLFYLGAGFAIWLLLPFTLKFLIGFAQQQNLQAVLSVQQVINFALFLVIAVSLTFELPLVLLLLAIMGVVSSKLLGTQWRAAILIILITAAVLTPTVDIFTQTIVALPLIILYALSIFLVRLAGK